MNKKKITLIFFFLSLVLLVIYFINPLKKEAPSKSKTSEIENIESSNLLSELNFSSEDKNGNIYTLIAQEGEIDFENNNIIFLKKIKATVKLNNSEEARIENKSSKIETSFDNL